MRTDTIAQVRVKKAYLQWRHNERDGVPSHMRLDCLLNLSPDAN